MTFVSKTVEFMTEEVILYTGGHPSSSGPLRDQHSSLVAHWLSVPGDHSSNPGGGINFSSFIYES